MNHYLSASEKKTWTLIQDKIKEKVTQQQFTTWFSNLNLIKLDAYEISILAPNSLCKEWIENNYMDAVTSSLAENHIFNREVRFIVEDNGSSEPKLHVHNHHSSPGAHNSTHINKNYNFDNFLVGPCNRLAHAAALAVSESPGTAYNPLFIHGSVGLGKTHLLHAILLQSQEKGHKALYLPCESFVNHYISTIKTGDWDSFRNKYRQIDVLLIDDVHFLANSQSSREEFFHTFNALYTRQKQIVLSSDCPPEEIPTIEERLISRFRWGLITRVDPPGFETSVAIIQKKTALLNMEISYDVARYLADNVVSSIREIEGTITNIHKYAKMNESKIDLSLVKQIIKGFSKQRHDIGIEKILNTVTKHYGLQLSQLHSKRKLKSITLPRQIAMHLARKFTSLSLGEIGGYMGGRDHTTVMHADDKIKKLKIIDRNISSTLRKLENSLIKQQEY
ncbi:chromosomal replication initiator protein DnaA [Candidatus Scalindua japonica]|uniref:Chromosomal replication initiator protein DnaA n=1 Tax=Candidatus Scalindua japonica TaxID=1284222 RepID=A0A286U0N0_9BACT|nr:chromosomal replication initiator protein DnaA [Candidatus Scalindua japonica]GAX61675.1 chromosomal replication initiator protein DnaA [Candidatus Scalindua japonica]